ncbi:MAG: hypothetical protein HXY22_05145 [Alphaproteobacteria bacterium]|nr:hypothetical protein [Alphaproteobacteria bacterium]
MDVGHFFLTLWSLWLNLFSGLPYKTEFASLAIIIVLLALGQVIKSIFGRS